MISVLLLTPPPSSQRRSPSTAAQPPLPEGGALRGWCSNSFSVSPPPPYFFPRGPPGTSWGGSGSDGGRWRVQGLGLGAAGGGWVRLRLMLACLELGGGRCWRTKAGKGEPDVEEKKAVASGALVGPASPADASQVGSLHVGMASYKWRNDSGA